MSRALSVDLRSRVLAAISAGLCGRQAAQRFGVGAASASRWRGLECASGDARPKVQGGDRRSGQNEQHAPEILRLYEAKPDISIEELRAALAMERGFVPPNPSFKAKGLKRDRNAPAANRPWRDAERHAVEAALPPHMRMPFAPMMYCRLDPQDALTLRKQTISEGMIDSRRGKTREPVWLPLPSPVASCLAGTPIHPAATACANAHGRAWTVGGLNTSWQKLRAKLIEKKLVQPGLTPKSLRHTVATILAESGHDERTIADVLGQKTVEMARHYSRRADRTRKNTATVESFDREVARRRGLSNRPGETFKPNEIDVE